MFGVVFLRSIGPVHVSPVDRAVTVSEISPAQYFVCKNSDVFIWEPGQVNRISVPATGISVDRAHIHEHSSPVDRDENISTAYDNGRLEASVAEYSISKVYHLL